MLKNQIWSIANLNTSYELFLYLDFSFVYFTQSFEINPQK